MTKNKLLELFENHKGEYLSGEAIAQSLGLSRTAIWKNINLLREEGYDIESTKKKGYTLNTNSDILSKMKLQQFLDKSFPIDHVEMHKVVDSTNKRALASYVTKEKNWIVVASEEQEKGEAKEEASFYSPQGKGVYMSVVIDLNSPMDAMDTIIKQNSEAVRVVIREITQVDTEIGEDNNLYYNNRKLSGIMTQMYIEAESKTIKSMIVGIGIYVHGADEKAIALTEITGEYCNRSELIARVLNKLYAYYGR
ncbi:HTH domain-containing protein [Niameybacter massiliensis]|uniref:HTH domain-containing protein n=1 Tax=Holtiella tumoricola TaxID=3018743 RepID=A0AA42IZP8_9FIRM|nr:HTH domain-containing protein [Holtiella tumoricola]MDA3730580.1 HTH domain-containing protein [Holtiella tumoricola]